MTVSRRIPRPASEGEWLDLRRPYIGASEALAVIGRHEHLTREELAVRKLTGTDAATSKAMRRGHALEDGTGLLWDEENGIATKRCESMWQRGPFIATPDRVPVEPDPPTWALEIKTTALLITQPLETWIAQCYVQAYCAGFDHVELAVLDRTMSLKCFTVDCDSDAYHLAIEELEAAAEAFLASIRQGLVPDDVGPLREWAVKALFPRSTHVEVALDDVGLKWVQELLDARELKRAGEQREQAAKDALAGLLVDADTATYEGAEVLSWRNAKDGMRVDWNALEAENPDLVERYRRAIPGARVMRITAGGREAVSAMPWERAEEETSALGLER